MILYSQKDPAYKDLLLKPSRLSVGDYGCFAMSLATLYQEDPRKILEIPGAFDRSGLLYSGIISKSLGGLALPKTKSPPKGWAVAMTDHYAPRFPTHFFLVNHDLGMQIDPLKYPANIENKISFKIVEYRPFTKTKFSAPVSWADDIKKWAIDNKIIESWGTDSDGIMLRVAQAIKNYHTNFPK